MSKLIHIVYFKCDVHPNSNAGAPNGQSRIIVTRNLRDLGRAELQFSGFRVLSPEDFLQE